MSALEDQVIASFRTVKEMLVDRNVDISALDGIGPDNLDALASTKSTFSFEVNPKLVIVYYLIRMRLSEIRVLLSTKIVGGNTTAATTSASHPPAIQYIFVFREDLGAVNRKAMSELFPGCQIFLIRELQFNVTRHSLVPRHELLSSEETASMMKAYNIRSKAQLPVLLHTDPVARYLGLRVGDVVRITRQTPSSGVEYFYRVVGV